MNGAQKLTRSISVSHTNLNCFGSFDGLPTLLLGKFRFGLELKRSKSVFDNTATGSDNDDIYLPSHALSDNTLHRAIDFTPRCLPRTVSHGDLTMAVSCSTLAKQDSEENRVSVSDTSADE